MLVSQNRYKQQHLQEQQQKRRQQTAVEKKIQPPTIFEVEQLFYLSRTIVYFCFVRFGCCNDCECELFFFCLFLFIVSCQHSAEYWCFGTGNKQPGRKHKPFLLIMIAVTSTFFVRACVCVCVRCFVVVSFCMLIVVAPFVHLIRCNGTSSSYYTHDCLCASEI